MDREYAERYGHFEQWQWWFRGRQRIIVEVLRRELGTRPSRWIVSVGSGPAEGLTWLRDVAGTAGGVVGVDADSVHARRVAPGLEYVVGDLEALPLAPASVDAVLALDVLEHLDDDSRGLREAVRLLRPGGLLLVTVPAMPSLWGPQDVINHHRRRYTRKTLSDSFARAELPRPSITYFNMLLFPPVAAVRWVRRALGTPGEVRSDFDDSQPGLLNDVLAGVFALERHLVHRVPMPVGVSLLATVHVC
ncbi:MAG: class I SAM-dependent methyltransferase [Deltaproteobacteria bacterium]|nr:MAG: class I SAM-dependent methyltransferase [Deltaproteobacteria bacterium]